VLNPFPPHFKPSAPVDPLTLMACEQHQGLEALRCA
jgi:hypothetical protein